MISKSKVFVKYEVKIASRLGVGERIVVYLDKFLLEIYCNLFSFRAVESEQNDSHPGRNYVR